MPGDRPVLEVLRAALRLGLTSFGGPIAHIGHFRHEYVERRRWLDDAAFADLVALCQALPGPASSQLGIAIGMHRAGTLGGIVAWIGFTLPSAIALVAFALLIAPVDVATAGWVHGLKLAAVAIVAHAVWSMARTLAPDPARRAIAVAAIVLVLSWPAAFVQLAPIAVIAGGGLAGRLLLRSSLAGSPDGRAIDGVGAERVSSRVGAAALAVFVGLLVGLPLVSVTAGEVIVFAEPFYRAGSLVFGGGHVVLPLLQSSVVDPGWVTQDRFLAGYGATQAVPGPLFTFAAYLGAVSSVGPGGITGATLATFAIFLPSFLLVYGILPFWDRLRAVGGARRALAGTNAAVVGLLAAALYSPIWTSTVRDPLDVVVAGAGLALLALGRTSPIAIVILAAIAGEILANLPGG
jgi:chromate transporter